MMEKMLDKAVMAFFKALSQKSSVKKKNTKYIREDNLPLGRDSNPGPE
jgi:hypothetical protein